MINLGEAIRAGVGSIAEEVEISQTASTVSSLLPLIILMLLAGMEGGLFDPSVPDGTQEITFENNPIPLIVRGSAYLLALGIVLTKFGASLHFFRYQSAFLLLAIYMAMSMLWSAFPVKVFINWGHLMGQGLVLVAAVYHFKSRPNSLFLVISGTLGLSILISIGVALIVPSVGISELGGRWQGLTGHPNTLGVIALVSVWSNTAGLYMPSDVKTRKWYWLGLAFSVIALAGARSVTSILVAAFIVVAMGFLVRLEGQPTIARMTKIFAAVWSLLVCFTMLLAFAPDLLEARGFLGLFGRNTTFTGRTKLWEEAWKLIETRPVLGWSFDSNMSVLKHLGGVGQFHSGYLDLLVRGGWMGIMLFLSVLVGVIYRILKLSHFEYRQAGIFITMVFAILIHNVTEASLVRATHPLWTVLLLLYFLSYELERVLSRAGSRVQGAPNVSTQFIPEFSRTL